MIEFQAIEALWCSIEMTIGVPFEARSDEDLKELNDRQARGRRRKLLRDAFPELEDEIRGNLARLPEKEGQRKYLLEIREKLAEAEPFLVEVARLRVEISKEQGQGGVVDWAEAQIHRAASPFYADLNTIEVDGSSKPIGILKSAEPERLQLCYLNMIAMGSDICLQQAIDCVDKQLRHIVGLVGATTAPKPFNPCIPPFTLEEADRIAEEIGIIAAGVFALDTKKYAALAGFHQALKEDEKVMGTAQELTDFFANRYKKPIRQDSYKESAVGRRYYKLTAHILKRGFSDKEQGGL